MKENPPATELQGLAERLVHFAKSSGADEAEITIADGSEFSVDVRLGKLENLVEAGARHLGLRIIKDMKTAYASSSDLGEETLKHLIRNAVKRAAFGSRDVCAGLPPKITEVVDSSLLNLFDPKINEFEAAKKISLALDTERIALADKRITNSHGASFITNEVRTILANSNGFSSSYDQTFCSLSVGLQAGSTNDKVEDYWSSTERFLSNLESPESIAKKAVERTVRQLNPRKIQTQMVPVIFEPSMTAWLLGFLFACVSGVAVYQKLSCLADRLGQRIADDRVTVIDDGLMPGKLGSRPFDSEGVPSQRTTIVENGVLRGYICNTYAARKLNLQSTGNADGTGVSPNNFYILPGFSSPQDIISSTKKGFILVRTIGHGLNSVTGDISRGAFGLWVEDGEVAYPVSEVTISGTLEKILGQVEMLGNDLEFRAPVCGPTIKVAELTVAGE